MAEHRQADEAAADTVARFSMSVAGSPCGTTTAAPAGPFRQPSNSSVSTGLWSRVRTRATPASPEEKVLTSNSLLTNDLGIVVEQMDRETWEELNSDLFLYGGKLPILLHRRESKFRRELRQRRGDPVGFLTGTPGYIPVPGQPVIAFPPWPVPSPQDRAFASTGPP